MSAWQEQTRETKTERPGLEDIRGRPEQPIVFRVYYGKKKGCCNL